MSSCQYRKSHFGDEIILLYAISLYCIYPGCLHQILENAKLRMNGKVDRERSRFDTVRFTPKSGAIQYKDADENIFQRRQWKTYHMTKTNANYSSQKKTIRRTLLHQIGNDYTQKSFAKCCAAFNVFLDMIYVYQNTLRWIGHISYVRLCVINLLQSFWCIKVYFIRYKETFMAEMCIKIIYAY